MDFNKYYKLWFHKINDNKWGIDSYKNICTIHNNDDFLYTFKCIKTVVHGMFFFMKDDIKPIYEDPANKNGGVWMWKINRNIATSVVLNLCYLMITNKLTVKKSDAKGINGISIKPKPYYCIIKIWIDGNQDVEIFKNNIQHILLSDGMYRENKE
jgi:hypothetical protein